MTAGVPPTPPSPPAATGGGAASGTGTLLQPPAAPDGAPLPLALQQALRGVVVARTAEGAVTLRTPLGPVTVQTGLTPPPGAQLTLVVQSLGPPVQVTLQPGAAAGGPPQARAPAAPGPGAGGAAGGTATAPVSTSLTEGSVLFATVTRPAGAPPGGQAAQASDLPAAARPAGPAPQAASGVPAAAPPPAAPGVLPAGTRIAMRLIGVQLPGGGSAAPAAPAAAPGAVQATVTGAAAAGQTQVQSPLGQMTLATGTPLPPGTGLSLEPVGRPLLPPLSASGEAAAGAGPRWETLRDSIETVLKAGPGAGQARMMQAVPQPSPQLPATVVFFLQALRHGSMRGWIGDAAAETLGRQSKVLLDRLGAEFGQMQRLSGEPVAPDWRLFLIPLFADGEAERLKLFIKDRRAGQDREGDEAEADRFLVEANFTRLGPFQFDGLARHKRLDLMVRTLRPLPRDMRDGIGALFADTASALGLTGSLTFQVTDRFDSPAGAPGAPTGEGRDGLWA